MAEKNGRSTGELAAIVDDTGRLQAQFGGLGAKEEAQSFLNGCNGRVNHLRGASIITGDKAKEAISKGRL